MLNTYINTQSASKFILIEDCLEHSGTCILKYLVDLHLKNGKDKVFYFTFEGVFNQIRSCINYYNYVSDLHGWIKSSNKKDFGEDISKIKASNCVVVIDSLAHAIFQYGIAIIYKILHQLRSNKDVVRIVTVLHQDLLPNPVETSEIFKHLAQLYLLLKPEIQQISYVYKKSSGKVIKQIENYKFNNGLLTSEPIKKIDSEVLMGDSLRQVIPDNLTTFKISVDDKEIESKNNLILPYLPKNNNEAEVGGNIFYQFDSVDDWDEEDPDDDLDI